MSEEPDSPLSAADQYHVGIVADDPVATMAQLTEVLGYRWADEIGGPITVSLPEGDTQVEMRTWYSRTTPRLEVVKSHPGTVWARADSGLHHVGYWADDVPATIAELEKRGYRFEAAGKLPDGQPYWAYLQAPAVGGAAGPRLEIVSRTLKPMMEHYFETGSVR
ncbi:MAG TPA: VOC family protein [Trebonia sp.]|nr:VOC family protein [Trebonia sp.]